MIESVASVGLMVDEQLEIRKNRIKPARNTSGKRLCIVTGTHGDELEGQYVCVEVQKQIREHPEYLSGIVDIYPALNPLGIDSIMRGFPGFDIDMNRIFPGTHDGAVAEYVASRIVDDIKGADMCIDIHASNIFLKEIPQIRINEQSTETLLPYAKLMNVDYIWVHSAATVLESTLAYTMNSVGVPTLVVEMGVGMRITTEYTRQLVQGIFNLMKHMGIWTGPIEPVKEPIISTDGCVSFLNAEHAGLFVPTVEHDIHLNRGDEIGNIYDPLTGELIERVISPVTGILFTLREYPIVDEGSLMARILTLNENDMKGENE